MYRFIEFVENLILTLSILMFHWKEFYSQRNNQGIDPFLQHQTRYSSNHYFANEKKKNYFKYLILRKRYNLDMTYRGLNMIIQFTYIIMYDPIFCVALLSKCFSHLPNEHLYLWILTGPSRNIIKKL